jgi:hypothetical protein
MNAKYLQHSWLDPRIEIRRSEIHGKGSFTRSLVRVGETLIVWGGQLFTTDEVVAQRVKPDTAAAISEKLVLGSPLLAPDAADQYLNHSCDPNLWMQDEVTLVARRDIHPNEELTADYALWEWDEAWIAAWKCNCGSTACRGTITGMDWKLPTLQERYRERFSPFINERIARLK